jgi:hypothetical protein
MGSLAAAERRTTAASKSTRGLRSNEKKTVVDGGDHADGGFTTSQLRSFSEMQSELSGPPKINSVRVQREMENRRSPLASIPPLVGAERWGQDGRDANIEETLRIAEPIP